MYVRKQEIGNEFKYCSDKMEMEHGDSGSRESKKLRIRHGKICICGYCYKFVWKFINNAANTI